MSKQLAKLTKVELRSIWPHEANNFTTWLAQEENLDLLSEEIGIDINLIQTEADVGRFNVDILAEEESSGRKIIIENQLEDTNHDHLGKIITYASGYDAEIIIWIVKNIKEEHQKAVEWLNNHTDEKINFFLIKIEVWQIEASNPAPKFDIIVSPNEWAKAIKTDTNAAGALTETKLQQLDFWNKFKDYTKQKDSRIRLQTPRPQHWYDVSMGNSKSHICLTVNSRENLLGCEVYISRNKELFNFLKERSKNIESEIGEPLEWIEATVASKIKVSKEISFLFDQEKYDIYFNWLYEKTILFKKVFSKYIDEFSK